VTTTNDLIQDTRQYLFSGQPEQLNRLSGDITNSATQMTFAFDISGIQGGVIIEIDLEQIFVFTTNSTSKQVTDCIRGYNGTTAAAHTSGAVVTVAPKFPTSRILRAINDDLRDLSSPVNGLYQIKTVDITYSPAYAGYDLSLATDVLGIAEIRYKQSGSSRFWPQVENYALLRNMATSDFASGFALVVYEGGEPGLPIRVRYKAPFATLSNLTDDVLAISGLPTTAHDLPPLGAAIRLAAGREVRRNFDEAQGEPRRAEEVPPTAQVQATRELIRLRQSRINAEQARLISSYPYELVG